MNRCLLSKTCLIPILLLAGWAGVNAQIIREFPAQALRGELTIVQVPVVQINGIDTRLSPGARIRNTQNFLVTPNTLTGNTYIVNYTREMNGLVHEVWLLTEEEVAQKRAGMEPVTNFNFAADAENTPPDLSKTPFNQLPRYKK